MLSAIATVLFVPPVNLAVVALAGMAVARWRPALGRRLTGLSVVLLLLLSLPVVAVSLLAGLEQGVAPARLPTEAQAIVILGGDARQVGAREADKEIGPLTLERLREGAALARATGLPVLVSGGGTPPVARLMADSLADDFGVRVRWVEPRALTTWDNAVLSAGILHAEGIDRVLLVTHAWHMRRALLAFRAAGLTALPAPLAPDAPPRLTLESLVPRVSGWQRSYFALHEWMGVAWYAWRARR